MDRHQITDEEYGLIADAARRKIGALEHDPTTVGMYTAAIVGGSIGLFMAAAGLGGTKLNLIFLVLVGGAGAGVRWYLKGQWDEYHRRVDQEIDAQIKRLPDRKT